jgi:ELWxxDGT repeat protein
MTNKYLLPGAYQRVYYWLYLLLSLAACPVYAQPVLVKDINVGTGSSNPTAVVNLNGALCFIARDGNGSWLWLSNGTATGTVKLAPVQVESYTQLNGILFFKATSTTSGTELWKSDGSVAGTVLLKDINPGVGSSAPAIVSQSNGILYFNAHDGSSTGLWRTDGTAAGTLRLSAASAANVTSINGGYLLCRY